MPRGRVQISLAGSAGVKIRDIIKHVEKDGWTLRKTRGSHRQFKHPVKRGILKQA
jgi:predicted RNA binding protein YcfA (HicA-like mRNA interferase family)